MIKINTIERVYCKILKTAFHVVNPIKKTIIKTECKVHQFINTDALLILKNDRYLDEFNFFSKYILEINKGAVWADQDFKSSSHFYNPDDKMDGLYGRKSAMELGIDYYLKARKYWKKDNIKKSLFYLGAALHILQDMTIPQHANIKLLNNHRQYETFIKRTYRYNKLFHVESGAYLLNSIESYIKHNAKTAIEINEKYRDIPNNEKRYYSITKAALPLAKRTTAGAMIMFYKDVRRKKRFRIFH